MVSIQRLLLLMGISSSALIWAMEKGEVDGWEDGKMETLYIHEKALFPASFGKDYSGDIWRELDTNAYKLVSGTTKGTPKIVLSKDAQEAGKLNRPLVIGQLKEKGEWQGAFLLNDENSVLLLSSDNLQYKKKSKKGGVSLFCINNNETADSTIQVTYYQEGAPETRTTHIIKSPVIAYAINGNGSLALFADNMNKIRCCDLEKNSIAMPYTLEHNCLGREKDETFTKIAALSFIQDKVAVASSPHCICLFEVDESDGFKPHVLRCFEVPAVGTGYTTKGVVYQYRVYQGGLVNMHHSRLLEYPWEYEKGLLSNEQILYNFMINQIAKIGEKDKTFEVPTLFNKLYHLETLSSFPESVQCAYRNILESKAQTLDIALDKTAPQGSCTLV